MWWEGEKVSAVREQFETPTTTTVLPYAVDYSLRPLLTRINDSGI
jgi:hypothetical protein